MIEAIPILSSLKTLIDLAATAKSVDAFQHHIAAINAQTGAIETQLRLTEAQKTEAIERAARSEQMVAERDRELAELDGALRATQEKLGKYESLSNFEEWKGALIKRRGDDGFHDVPFCFECRTSLALGNVYACKKCGWVSVFNHHTFMTEFARLTNSPPPPPEQEPRNRGPRPSQMLRPTWRPW